MNFQPSAYSDGGYGVDLTPIPKPPPSMLSRVIGAPMDFFLPEGFLSGMFKPTTPEQEAERARLRRIGSMRRTVLAAGLTVGAVYGLYRLTAHTAKH